MQQLALKGLSQSINEIIHEHVPVRLLRGSTDLLVVLVLEAQVLNRLCVIKVNTKK